MTSVWLCRENIFGHIISRLVQVTSYPFFKTSESCYILCAIPCSSLLSSTLFFLVAFRSGDFKFRESCLTVTKLLWNSYVNRNTDGSKENVVYVVQYGKYSRISLLHETSDQVSCELLPLACEGFHSQVQYRWIPNAPLQQYLVFRIDNIQGDFFNWAAPELRSVDR